MQKITMVKLIFFSRIVFKCSKFDFGHPLFSEKIKYFKN
jgi:uncharacterized phage-associated protein